MNSIDKVPEEGDSSLDILAGSKFRYVDNNPAVKAKYMKLVDTIVVGSEGGNEFIRRLLYSFVLTDAEKDKIYSKCSPAMKREMIEDYGYTRNGSLQIVKSGETIDTIIKNYLRTHLDKFPKLKDSVDSDAKKWTADRITEALDDYLKDFRADILKDLGISNPKAIQAGDIIDLDKVKWTEHQPGWWNYNLTY